MDRPPSGVLSRFSTVLCPTPLGPDRPSTGPTVFVGIGTRPVLHFGCVTSDVGFTRDPSRAPEPEDFLSPREGLGPSVREERTLHPGSEDPQDSGAGWLDRDEGK